MQISHLKVTLNKRSARYFLKVSQSDLIQHLQNQIRENFRFYFAFN